MGSIFEQILLSLKLVDFRAVSLQQGIITKDFIDNGIVTDGFGAAGKLQRGDRLQDRDNKTVTIIFQQQNKVHRLNTKILKVNLRKCPQQYYEAKWR